MVKYSSLAAKNTDKNKGFTIKLLDCENEL
jgi:hypothetical protein